MSSIPKDGWSCNNCRSCVDCGNKIRSGNLSQKPTNGTDTNELVCNDCTRHRAKNDCIVCGKGNLQK